MTGSGAASPAWGRQCRPFGVWPEADQQAWAAAMAPGDWFEPGGAGSAWAPVTRVGIIKSYGRWLHWLDATGRLDPLRPLAERITPEAVQAFMAALQPVNAPKTVLFRVVGLAQAARALAPDVDWAWLWRIAAWLQRTALPVRDKRHRLVGQDQLIAFGGEHMRGAGQGGAPAWQTALQYRDGLTLLLLAVHPLRISNLAAIEIDRHLVVTADGYDLRFPAAEMKNRRPYAFAVADGLVGPLARYLSQHRPVLAERSRFRGATAAGPGSRLWLSKIGAPMTPGKLYQRITTLTRQRFGHAVNPHAFRDEAATDIATRDPEHVGITMSVLGHTRLATSERYYNHAQAYEACRLYQQWIQALRR